MRVRVTEGRGLKKGRASSDALGARVHELAGANALTCDQFDPYSKQPELKHAGGPNRAPGAALSAGLGGIARSERSLPLFQASTRLLAEVPYATVLYGRKRH